MNPELIINGPPIDFELGELLGEKPADFLVLCFDGVQLDDFGTPYDTPNNRIVRQDLIDGLNDKSKKSLWPKMWLNWKPNICKQFGLPETTTDKDFRPVVSYKISRVCHGYSQYLHVAIGLFEKIASRITSWGVLKLGNGKFRVEIIAKDGAAYSGSDDDLPLLIVKTVLRLLKANQATPSTET